MASCPVQANTWWKHKFDGRQCWLLAIALQQGDQEGQLWAYFLSDGEHKGYRTGVMPVEEWHDYWEHTKIGGTGWHGNPFIDRMAAEQAVELDDLI